MRPVNLNKKRTNPPQSGVRRVGGQLYQITRYGAIPMHLYILSFWYLGTF